ncbi:enoyl-CoA hydratase [Stappia stellulata]|uniref:enoyl-CoA hydratase n=1 Tax=Stappia stellulata TaxID=71235 RepID=UPI00040E8595|nr:enoyl-CoA hydratase [Stappia stellulata]
MDSATQPPLVETRQGGVLTLTMNRPERKNSLSEEMMEALQSALDAARDDPEAGVIVLCSTGNVFCAGHDLKEMTAARDHADRGRAYYAEVMTRCAHLMQTIVTHPKPVIAEVDGVATAAGLQLVASCDLAISSEDARFCTPGVNIGLFCSTPMVALSRNVSRKQAMEMLLTGEIIDASTAREFGLVNRVVPQAYLKQVVAKYAGTIASKSPLTLKIGKEAFYRQAEMPLDEAYRHCAQVMVDNMMARDAEEGIGAFIEKREPVWTGE